MTTRNSPSNGGGSATPAEVTENPTHAQWPPSLRKRYVGGCLTRFIPTPTFNSKSTKTCAFNIRNGLNLTVTVPHATPTSCAWRNYSALLNARVQGGCRHRPFMVKQTTTDSRMR